MKQKKFNFKLLLVGIMIMGLTYYISSQIFNYYQATKLNHYLQEKMITEQNNTTTIDFTALTALNSDTVGWIKLANTNINYPVVQSDDNRYYLTHSFTQAQSEAGAIFLDYRNNLDELSKNNIIYGHGRLDGSMFGSLSQVLESSWLQDPTNHYVYLSTPTKQLIFKIVSVYTIQKESYYLTSYFSNNDYFNQFLQTILQRSTFDFQEVLTAEDKILTLSTCQNNYGKRIVVHAKLVQMKET